MTDRFARAKTSLGRKLLFSLLPLLFVLGILEVAAQYYTFRQRGEGWFALSAVLSDWSQARTREVARGVVEELDLPPAESIYEALYGPTGRELLQRFQERYEGDFLRLARLVEGADARLVVLYVPSARTGEVADRVHASDRTFYGRLAASQGAPFVDATSWLRSAPRHQSYLLPENTHLSRLGNQLLAENLAEILRQPDLAEHRSRVRFERRPRRLGDLPPGQKRLWHDDSLPFLLTTNHQGLRMARDLVFPKVRPRVLLLGDSFTFGINLPEPHTYPALLQSMLSKAEVVNAGVVGYTISDQMELFEDRARYTEPDIVVLQTLYNDLYGYLSFERSLFARDRRTGSWLERIRHRPEVPDPLEVDLMASIRSARAASR